MSQRALLSIVGVIVLLLVVVVVRDMLAGADLTPLKDALDGARP